MFLELSIGTDWYLSALTTHLLPHRHRNGRIIWTELVKYWRKASIIVLADDAVIRRRTPNSEFFGKILMWRRRMTQHSLVTTRLTMIFSIVVRLGGAKSSWWYCRSRGPIILRIDTLYNAIVIFRVAGVWTVQD